jgi:hypothetical protein
MQMNWKNNIWSLLCLLFLAVFYIQSTKDVVQEKRFFDAHWTNLRDDAGIYYAYLPATFIKKDFRFSFLDREPATVPEKGIQYWAFKSDKGGWVPKMTLGKALLDAPFFFVADAYTLSSEKFERTGFSLPYKYAIVAATLFYTLLGFFMLRLVLLRFFNDRITAMALLTIALGTNLFHYTTYETGYTHPHNFFMLSTLIWLALSWKENKSIWRSIIFGLLCGLLVLVRPINLILLLPLPFFSNYFLPEQLSKSTLLSGLKTFLFSRQMLVALLAAFVINLPQLLFWKMQSGSWFYYSYNDEGFFFTKPHIFNGLFSFRKGWFIYTPIMLFAVLGLYWLIKQYRWMGWSLTITFLLFVYITFSWWCWWYGGGFGARTMIDFYPYLALPLAALLTIILKKHWIFKVVTGLLLLGAIKLNTFQTKQYHLSLIHWDSMTYEAYKAVFMQDKFPENYAEMLAEPEYQKQKETGNE